MNPNYNQTITVFRKIGTAWNKTVFGQCFWKSGITVVQNNTEASQANTYTVRIPLEAAGSDFSASLGDVVVLGECADDITGKSPNTAAEVLRRNKPNAFLVSAYSDNTSYRMAKHYRLGGLTMDVEIKWNKTSDQIAKEKTRGNDGLLFLANEAKRLMDPYVPADSLALAQNVSVHVEGETGVIEYQSPYAHYQYKGVAYGPNYPLTDGGAVMGYYSPPHKSSTGKRLKYSHFRHPQATSEWDKAMMMARKGDLVRALENYLGGK